MPVAETNIFVFLSIWSPNGIHHALIRHHTPVEREDVVFVQLKVRPINNYQLDTKLLTAGSWVGTEMQCDLIDAGRHATVMSCFPVVP